MAQYGGENNINNNEISFIKAKIDSNLSIVLKKILDKLGMTQQELIEKKLRSLSLKMFT